MKIEYGRKAKLVSGCFYDPSKLDKLRAVRALRHSQKTITKLEAEDYNSGNDIFNEQLCKDNNFLNF